MSPNRKPSAMSRTVAVILASAAAKQDLQKLEQFAERRFEFRLLAAADSEHPVPPMQGWHDLQHLLKANATTVGDEIRLSLQAEGFAALLCVAGFGAHLTSPDGAIDIHFYFDRAGYALVVLAESPDVRQALQHFHVTLDAAVDAPNHDDE